MIDWSALAATPPARDPAPEPRPKPAPVAPPPAWLQALRTGALAGLPDAWHVYLTRCLRAGDFDRWCRYYGAERAGDPLAWPDAVQLLEQQAGQRSMTWRTSPARADALTEARALWREAGGDEPAGNLAVEIEAWPDRRELDDALDPAWRDHLRRLLPLGRDGFARLHAESGLHVVDLAAIWVTAGGENYLGD